MKIRQHTSELWLPHPRDKVFDFFSDAHNLERITPPWLNFETLTPKPIELKPGALIDYRLRIRGMPMKWRTEITVWQPPAYFEDKQLKGPYKLWLHHHYFEEKDGGTLIRDDVDYAVPGWILDPMVHSLLVGPDVKKIFAYREEKIKELFSDGVK